MKVRLEMVAVMFERHVRGQCCVGEELNVIFGVCLSYLLNWGLRCV